jgi:hypothetical protein
MVVEMLTMMMLMLMYRFPYLLVLIHLHLVVYMLPRLMCERMSMTTTMTMSAVVMITASPHITISIISSPLLMPPMDIHLQLRMTPLRTRGSFHSG